MAIGVALLVSFFVALIAIGLTRSWYQTSDRGLSSSQWLFVGLFWLLSMVITYIWIRYRLPNPLAFLPWF